MPSSLSKPDLSDKGASPSCRIDVWLWRARFFKTRTKASEFVSLGQIRLFRNGLMIKPDKPAYNLYIGDDLTFSIKNRLISLSIEDLGERRGPPQEARYLYREIHSK